MATFSLSASLSIPPLLNNPNISSKPKTFQSFLPPSSSSSLNPLQIPLSLSSKPPRFSAFAAPPELVSSGDTTDFSSPPQDEESEIPSASPAALDAGADMMAPKQKIRIKLKSYYVSLIEDSAKQIMEAARTSNAKTVGPVPLPTKKQVYCVLKSPHVHKDARFHFEIRTHQRLIDIFYPTAQTIDSLMKLDLPAGVDVQVKL